MRDERNEIEIKKKKHSYSVNRGGWQNVEMKVDSGCVRTFM